MPLPRPRVQNKYRYEEINLQPYGNTVSVEAPSDNPFEDDRDVEVFTQASGGMAGADPRQRSRGLMVQRPRNTSRQGGRSPAFHLKMDAAHPGFMPGMGDLSGRQVRRAPSRPRVRVTHPGFVPGMGELPSRRSRAFMPGMSGLGDEPGAQYNAPAATPQWLQAIQAAGQTTASVLNAQEGAKTAASTARAAQAMAAAEAARAEQMRSQSMMSTSLANMNKYKLLTYGLIGVGVLMLGRAPLPDRSTRCRPMRTAG